MPHEADVTTHDLRSSALDRKRQAEHKQKWEPKWAVGAAEAVRFSPTGKKRPARRCSQQSQASDRKQNEKVMHRASLARKQDVLGSQDAVEDCSGDETASQASGTPSVEEDIKYSFDAQHGPVGGSQVLGHALSVAVERFESRQTDKLIREEYEVLDTHDEDGEGCSACVFEADDIDFEFI